MWLIVHSIHCNECNETMNKSHKQFCSTTVNKGIHSIGISRCEYRIISHDRFQKYSQHETQSLTQIELLNLIKIDINLRKSSSDLIQGLLNFDCFGITVESVTKNKFIFHSLISYKVYLKIDYLLFLEKQVKIHPYYY